MSFQLQQQLHSKQRELEQLKQINSTIETMKTQLDLLSKQVKQIEVNSRAVANIMKIWESISRAISEASVGLLRYVKKDYEFGPWKKQKVRGFDTSIDENEDDDHDDHDDDDNGRKTGKECTEQQQDTSGVNPEGVDADRGPPLPESLVRIPIPEELLSDGEDSEDEMEEDK